MSLWWTAYISYSPCQKQHLRRGTKLEWYEKKKPSWWMFRYVTYHIRNNIKQEE